MGLASLSPSSFSLAVTHLMRSLNLGASHFRIAQLQTECVQHAIRRNAGGHCSGRRLMMMHRLVRHAVAVAAPRTTAKTEMGQF